MTTAEAFLRINPRLGEEYLAGLVADLDRRLGRALDLLRAEGADAGVMDAVRDCYLAHPFEAARPQAGEMKFRWAWERLVQRIGTPAMRAALDRGRERSADQSAMLRAEQAQAQGASVAPASPEAVDATQRRVDWFAARPVTPEIAALFEAERAQAFSIYRRPESRPPATTRPAATAQRTQRILRDVARGRHILQRDGATADEIAAYTQQRLAAASAAAERLSAEAERVARRLEREARQADERAAARRWTPPVDDDLAEDERVLAEIQRHWTPTRVLNTIMRPATRAIARVRKAERELNRAAGRHAAQRAGEELARVRAEWDVAPVLGADLAAEREALRPIVEAAIAGTSPRWRHRFGRVFDDKGRDLMPPCLRMWQVL